LERENARRAIQAEAKAAIIERLGEEGFCEIWPNMPVEELQKKSREN
jgi:hypothetical protein